MLSLEGEGYVVLLMMVVGKLHSVLRHYWLDWLQEMHLTSRLQTCWSYSQLFCGGELDAA